MTELLNCHSLAQLECLKSLELPPREYAEKLYILLQEGDLVREFLRTLWENERQVVAILMEIGTDALPTLIEILDDSSEDLRAEAAYMLSLMDEVGEEAVPALISALEDDVQYAADALCSAGETAVPALIEKLGDEDGHICMQAAWILYQMDSSMANLATRTLIGLLSDTNPSVRTEAIQYLRSMGSSTISKAVPALINALNDSDDSVREQAAYVLIGAGYAIEKVIPVLVDLLRRAGFAQLMLFPPSHPIAAVLAEIGCPAVPALIELLVDESSDIRTCAAEALVQIGESAIPALTEALTHENRQIRERARVILSEIGVAG